MELRFFEIYRSAEYLTLLLEGALTSAWITLLSGFLGFLVALVLSGVRYRKVPVLNATSVCYVEFIRREATREDWCELPTSST